MLLNVIDNPFLGRTSRVLANGKDAQTTLAHIRSCTMKNVKEGNKYEKYTEGVLASSLKSSQEEVKQTSRKINHSKLPFLSRAFEGRT